jgi:hypothetical protein
MKKWRITMIENPYVHRHKFKIDKPDRIGDLQIDDYVSYIKEGIPRRGYIYCFRQFGYTWFAWIYFDTDTLITEDCIPVEQLKKVRNDALKYATNKLES